ncbi:MAG: preprotein translocase subunit SecE [Candidatus Rokubacteria bacterium]|nr:preprotein translocase subunit SecE [Candidatus Rokubacteria bacterium]MBI2553893.1 preprotein translocase subunit SecE [Candidatus Rokubacteria bacterium]
MGRIQQFLREVMAEFRKVNWPSQPMIVNSTAVVLVVTGVLAVFLWVVDLGLARIVGVILK